MAPIIAHVVAAERQHRHRIAPHHAHRAGGRRGRFGCQCRPEKSAMLPVERLIDERNHLLPARAEKYRADGHALRPHGLPRQSRALLGTGSSCPSHQTVPSGRNATLVKMVSLVTVRMALRLVFEPVPGATPKQPASGLTAQSLPSGPTRSQEISSPMVWIFQPFMVAGGTSIARLVLPQALGKAPQT